MMGPTSEITVPHLRFSSGTSGKMSGAKIPDTHATVCAYGCDNFRTAKFCWTRSPARRCLRHYVNLDCSSAIDEVSSTCAAAHDGLDGYLQSLQPRATSSVEESPVTEYQHLYVLVHCLYRHVFVGY